MDSPSELAKTSSTTPLADDTTPSSSEAPVPTDPRILSRDFIQARRSLDFIQQRLDRAISARRGMRTWHRQLLWGTCIASVLLMAGGIAGAFLRIKLHNESSVALDDPSGAGLCAGGEGAANTAGAFDLYVLSLAWTPHYCSTPSGRKDRAHCGGQGGQGAFVLTGLWPERDPKGWPECCPTAEGLTSDVIESMTDVMPSAYRVATEWYRHGTCSGLSSKDFFEQARTAFEMFKVPEAMRTARQYISTTPERLAMDLYAANPSFPKDSVVVNCDGSNLNEVHVCLTKSLLPRLCSREALNYGCPYQHITVLPPSARRLRQLQQQPPSGQQRLYVE